MRREICNSATHESEVSSIQEQGRDPMYIGICLS